MSVAPEHEVEIETLEQYRLRYALFKTDPRPAGAHAAAPWLNVWDDHEVRTTTARQLDLRIPPELFVHRRPSRTGRSTRTCRSASAVLPKGPDTQVYRRYDVGSLARLNLLDNRQYRDPVPKDEADQQSEKRTILGAKQEQWLYDGLRRSPAT